MAVTALFADIRNQMTLVSDDIGTLVRSSTILKLENNNLILICQKTNNEEKNWSCSCGYINTHDSLIYCIGMLMQNDRWLIKQNVSLRMLEFLKS